MIVTDASVLTNLPLYTDERGAVAREALGQDTAWAAPEHWKAEVFSAVRGLTIGRKVSLPTARRAVLRIPQLSVDSVTLDGLLLRMWDMRSNITGYDAAYVALAETQDLTLVTADRRLAGAAVGYCRVELTAPRGQNRP